MLLGVHSPALNKLLAQLRFRIVLGPVCALMKCNSILYLIVPQSGMTRASARKVSRLAE